MNMLGKLDNMVILLLIRKLFLKEVFCIYLIKNTLNSNIVQYYY